MKDKSKIPTEENPIPYRFPFIVGRKQKRAVLDADGLEIVIFPKGSEEMARITCLMWNEWYEELCKAFGKLSTINNINVPQ